MTPRQFNYLAERHQERVKREDRRAGEIVAMLYNANRDSEKDPSGLDWRDFFPEWKEKSTEQTEEEMFKAMLMFTKQREGLSS